MNKILNSKGDITLILAIMFSVVTLAVVTVQQLIAGQKITELLHIAENIESPQFSEIIAWRNFYRSKANLPLDVQVFKGSTTTSTSGVSTTTTYISTGLSMSEASTPGDGVNGGRFCAGTRRAKLCIGNKSNGAAPVGSISWEQEAYVKASNPDEVDAFGYALSVDGDTLAVGAFHESSNVSVITNGTTSSSDNSQIAAGATYIYRRVGSSWAQEAYIKASNAHGDDYFGTSLSISGDTVAVGAPLESNSQTSITNGTSSNTNRTLSSSGAVYIYKRTGSTWVQQAYVKAANAEAGDVFGQSVAIHNDTLAVGAYYEGSNQTTITNDTTASPDNSASKSGAVYVYRRIGNAWSQEAYVKASNPDINDNFGENLALNGETLAVGANKESSNQTTITNDIPASSDNSKVGSGAVYIYKRSGNIWSQEAYVKAFNADTDDYFGKSVSVSADTLAVGAFGEASNETGITNDPSAGANNTKPWAGAVYVYKRTGNTWAREAYIKAANTDDSDMFGVRVSINANTLAVGSMGEDSNQNIITNGPLANADNTRFDSGAVYVYKRTGSTWAQEAYVKASNADAFDHFGLDVFVNADTLAAGSREEDSNETSILNGTTASTDNHTQGSGAVYVYKRTLTP